MATPTAQDPLGQRPDPADFGDMLNLVVDERIKQHWTGRTSPRFTNVTDVDLVLELLSRGWAVFRPVTADIQMPR